MLVITEAARSLIGRIPATTSSPATAGLRIAVRPDSGQALRVGAVAAPEPGDTVLEDDEVRVFLGPVAQARLDRHALDVRLDGQGRAEFVTRPLPA